MQTAEKKKFNIKNAKKCLAKTRKGKFCQSPAMKNGKCRMHGGKSTGAKTLEGLERIREANLKSGFYTKENVGLRKLFSELFKEEKRFLEKV